MATPKPDQLGDLKPIYLIHGKEPMRLREAVDRLRTRLAAVADLDFNYDVFEGSACHVNDVIAAANTLPWLSERRLVVVRDVDKMHAGALERLAEYAADPAETTVLVLVAEKVAKGSSLYKRVEAHGQVFEFAAPRASEYPREVEKRLKARGCDIERDAAARLVELVGTDLQRLDVEIDKLVAYARTAEGGCGLVTRELVDELVEESAPARVFDLTDALGAHDTERCLRTLSRLIAGGDPVPRITAVLVKHVRELLKTRALLDRGENESGIRAALKFGPRDGWRAGKLIAQARGFSSDDLSVALRAAAAMDEQTKTSPGDPRLALEQWLVATCGS